MQALYHNQSGLKRKTWLKLLRATKQNHPSCWDLQVDNLLTKASSRMYVMRTCRSFGHSKEQSTILFDTLIMSSLTYGIEYGVLHSLATEERRPKANLETELWCFRRMVEGFILISSNLV